MCRDLGYAEIERGRYRSVCRSFETENNDETQRLTHCPYMHKIQYIRRYSGGMT